MTPTATMTPTVTDRRGATTTRGAVPRAPGAARHGAPAALMAIALMVLAACGGGRGPAGIEYGHAPRASKAEIAAHVAEASGRFNVPQAWIHAVMEVESGARTHFSDGRPIVSHAGAMGLMQVMPATYAELADKYGLGRNPFEPRDNILAGTAYLREMYDRYGSPGFLGAYNAGPGRFGDFVYEGRPLPGETRRYIAMLVPRVAGLYPPNEMPRRTVEQMPRVYASQNWFDPDGVAALPASIRGEWRDVPG
ncbi:MAG: lytic transglycosylase domain-containing protein [Azospirillaceae bacterium]